LASSASFGSRSGPFSTTSLASSTGLIFGPCFGLGLKASSSVSSVSRIWPLAETAN
jgi:hypothetical protein